ncbi:LysM peptidoglycan-binding domain-containing protein [Thermodesulfobacteriota bacterium]
MQIRKLLRVIVCLFAVMMFPLAGFAAEGEESIDTESGFYYTVQKGDTLWDISQRFSDSASLWPDLWNENRQIPNPHRIYPGERIRLLYHSDVESVTQVITEKRAEQAEPVQEVKKEEGPYYYYSRINTAGFIREKPFTSLGVIFKVTEEKTLIGQGDLIYVKPAPNTGLTPGSHYTVYRISEPIIDIETKATIGIQHYLTGVIEIVKVMPEFVVATVARSYRAIKINDLLMPYRYRSPKINLVESPRTVEGKIILGEERQYAIGQGHVIFINKGFKDGVKAGQSFVVYYNETHKFDPKAKEGIQLTPIYHGKLLVLHSEETTSTTIVTRSVKTIHVGDKILTPVPEFLR